MAAVQFILKVLDWGEVRLAKLGKPFLSGSEFVHEGIVMWKQKGATNFCQKVGSTPSSKIV